MPCLHISSSFSVPELLGVLAPSAQREVASVERKRILNQQQREPESVLLLETAAARSRSVDDSRQPKTLRDTHNFVSNG